MAWWRPEQRGATREDSVSPAGDGVRAGDARVGDARVGDTAVSNATNFLDPATLARISNLELLARTVVDGFINGLHRTPHLGMSTDFAEHRVYMPGDDIRRMDWRLFARTDRLYLKEFEADTVMNFSVLMDVSPSMQYGSGSITKLEYARFLAACLVYFAHGQRDRVGFAAFDDDVIEVIPPSSGRLAGLLHAIARAAPGPAARPTAGGPGDLEVPLRKLAETFRRRSLVLLISDLYAEPQRVVEAIGQLRQRGNDVMVTHILDRAEIEFPFDTPAPFEDLETGTRLSVVPNVSRERYRSLVQAHIAELQRRCVGQGVDYALFDTSQPLDYALFHFLSRRQRLLRAHAV